MKRALFLIVLLVIGITLGWLQWVKLGELRGEIVRQEERLRSPASKAERSTAASPAPPVSQTDLDQLHEVFVQRFVATSGSGRLDRRDFKRRRLQSALIASRLSAAEMASVIADLEADPRLGAMPPGMIGTYFMEEFGRYAPVAAMRVMDDRRDLPDWEQYYAGAFRQFLKENPREAIRWYEKESERGHPAMDQVRQGVLFEEARIDPRRMLERVTRPEFANDQETTFMLGGFVNSILREPSEHLQFLEALRQAGGRTDAPPLIGKIREDYVGSLSHTMQDWPIGEVSLLVDSEFRPEEKLSFAHSFGNHYGGHTQPQRVLEWLQVIDLDVWSEWKVRNEQRGKHPAVAVFTRWASRDSAVAGKWLARQPDGPLTERMAAEHARLVGQAE